MVKETTSGPDCVGAIVEAFVPCRHSHPLRVISPLLMAMLLLGIRFDVAEGMASIANAGAPVLGEPLPAGPPLRAIQQAGPSFSIFLPLVLRNYGQPLLMGVYAQGWLALEATYTSELNPLDTWTGKQHSLLATFIDIATPNNQAYITDQLTAAWTHGYTPFVNLMACTGSYVPATCTSEGAAGDIAGGNWDAYLNAWAAAFKSYAEGSTGRAAFIAPLPEMNGSWTPYNGCSPHSPTDFKNAYDHVRAVFAANAVPAGSVRWVFAPNGYSDCGAIADYYPGDVNVDVVGLSSYNYGYSPRVVAHRWDPPSFVYGNYLPTLRAMAPAKPIILSQTGTTAYYDNTTTPNHAAKNQWLNDAFNYLAGEAQVRGLIYYNIQGWELIDWPVHLNGALTDYTGYQTGAANPAYRYITPADLKNMPLLP
jgi:hypothetical protein